MTLSGENKNAKINLRGHDMEKKRSSTRIKRQSIIGLPVIEGRTGKKLGVVRDLYTSGRNSQLEGFYITNKGWGSKTIGIPFEGVTIGFDAVIAEGDLPAEAEPREEKNEDLAKLLNKKVVREDGMELGYISDIILDPLTGRIEGLELSESVIGDLISGRRILPYEPHEYTEGEMLVVTLEQAESITPSNKGIKNIFFNKI
jgi:uncharacterized protein YrrD